MDKLEFSIAMKLIKMKLKGAILPTVLPISMKQQPGFSSSKNVPVTGFINMILMPKLFLRWYNAHV